MPRRGPTLHLALTPEERAQLETWRDADAMPAGLARRARLVLLCAEGVAKQVIAAKVGLSRRHCRKWLLRFQAYGLVGLYDAPGRQGTTLVRPVVPASNGLRPAPRSPRLTALCRAWGHLTREERLRFLRESLTPAERQAVARRLEDEP